MGELAFFTLQRNCDRPRGAQSRPHPSSLEDLRRNRRKGEAQGSVRPTQRFCHSRQVTGRREPREVPPPGSRANARGQSGVVTPALMLRRTPPPAEGVVLQVASWTRHWTEEE